MAAAWSEDPQLYGAGSTIGAYQIVGVLGRGGMGVVYDAIHRRSGRRVALKTLQRADPRCVAAIEREIAALAHTDHPGVVRVHDHGRDDTVPWYAMDRLEGQTLRQALRTHAASSPAARGQATLREAVSQLEPLDRGSGSDPLPASGAFPGAAAEPASFERALPLLLSIWEVCRVLVHVHGCGVVHRDLKPENIFVRDDGSVVLVDFGLASRSARDGREQLELPSSLGSAGYMAPEQLEGIDVDGRADLYAVGAMLYECLAGTPPLGGRVSSAADFARRPLPLALRAPGVPEPLARLIERLIEPSPAQRPSYAHDVVVALWQALQGDQPMPPTPDRPLLYRAPCVGRETARANLDAALASFVRRRHGSAHWIVGESGRGKTRLAMELLARARHARQTAIVCHGARVGVGSDGGSLGPLALLAPLLAALARHLDRGDAGLAAHFVTGEGAVVAPYLRPMQAPRASLAAVPPQEARTMVVARLAEAVELLARSTPLLLVVDDLQWSDELSLEVLSVLAERAVSGAPLLLLGMARAEHSTPAFAALLAVPGATQTLLGPLSAEAIEAMAQGMLAADRAPPRLVPWLVGKSAGNPLFAAEYLRCAIDSGALTRRGGRWHFDAASFDSEHAVPATVAALMRGRVRGLSPAALELLRVAAILGTEVDVPLTRACLVPTFGLEAASEELHVRGLFVSDELGLRIAHDALRDSVVEELPRELSQALHRRAGQACAARAEASPAFWLRAAEHLSAAREVSAASRAYVRAVAFAADHHAHHDALRLADAGLAAGAAPPDRSELLEQRGELCLALGRVPDARAAFEAALDGGPSELGRARLLRKLAKTWELHHQHAEASALGDEAERLLDGPSLSHDPSWWAERIELTLGRLWVCYWQNRVADMDALVRSWEEPLEVHGSSYQRVRFLQLRVMLEVRRERYALSDATLALARRASALLASATQGERAAVDFVLFFALVLHGSLAEAEQLGRALLAWAERTHTTPLRIRCLTYLSVIARRRRRQAEVRSLAEACEQAARAAGLGEYLGVALANQAWCAYSEGHRQEAQALARQATDIWSAVKVPYPMQWLARFPLLALAVGAGDTAEVAVQVSALRSVEQMRLPEPLDLLVQALDAGAGVEEQMFREKAEECGML